MILMMIINQYQKIYQMLMTMKMNVYILIGGGIMEFVSGNHLEPEQIEQQI